MDRQAIDVHGRIAFSNANCALPQDGSKAPMAEGPLLAHCEIGGTGKIDRNRGIADIAGPAVGSARS